MKDKGLEKFPLKPCNVSTFKLFNIYNVLKERKEKLFGFKDRRYTELICIFSSSVLNLQELSIIN